MRLATLVIAILLLCAPLAAAAGTSTTPAPLVSSVPFLSGSSPTVATATSTTPTSSTPASSSTPGSATTPTPATPGASTSTTASATPNGDLPYTGLNLLPETIAAVALIFGGVLLRLRQGPHRGWRSRW